MRLTPNSIFFKKELFGSAKVQGLFDLAKNIFW